MAPVDFILQLRKKLVCFPQKNAFKYKTQVWDLGLSVLTSKGVGLLIKTEPKTFFFALGDIALQRINKIDNSSAPVIDH